MSSWITRFGLFFMDNWLSPKRKCSECYQYLAVEVSIGTTVCQKHTRATRMRTVHLWNGGYYLYVFDGIKRTSVDSVWGNFQLAKKGFIPSHMVDHHYVYIHQLNIEMECSRDCSIFLTAIKNLWIIIRLTIIKVIFKKINLIFQYKLFQVIEKLYF